MTSARVARVAARASKDGGLDLWEASRGGRVQRLKSSSTARLMMLASTAFGPFQPQPRAVIPMGDKSPKANDKKKKQDTAAKGQKKAAPAAKAPAPPPAKKGK